MEPQQPAKKRASRAKKTVASEAPSVVSAFGGEQVPAIFVEEVATPVVPTPKAKKTAARKPPVVASVTPEGIQGSLSCAEQRPLIVHMPIKMSDIEIDLFAPTPSAELQGDGLANPYDPDDSIAIFGGPHTIDIPTPKTPSPAKTEAAAVERPSLPLHYSEKLMVRFQDANRDQQLPESTNVACFWCCHTFNGSPCVIPTGIEEGIWRVYGNFCCPECAAAQLFSERLDSHVQWERYALLNRLYANGLAVGEGVRLAPARTVLRMFGGPMDITDFRAAITDKRMRIDVMTPPMISIIQVMDTKPIDFYDAAMKNTFIPWEMDRMQRPGAQGLRLRRTKPVAEKEATLEYCMGIVV